MAITKEEQRDWLNQVQEETIDPGREIVDPHHHMWRTSGLPTYLLEDLWADTESGHNIVKTVFMECGAEYRRGGPEHLRPIGETEFVDAAASASRGQNKAVISGIVGHTDLTQSPEIIREVCKAHATASSLFRGIRHGGAHDPTTSLRWGDATPYPDLFERPDFRRGVAELGTLGYTYDSWHYHFQNDAFTDLAQAAPETTIVLDHFGTPVAIGAYEGKMADVLIEWKASISRMAQSPNVVVKIGGLAMPPNGFGWHRQDVPPDSDQVASAHREYYLHTIDAFGPSRCMFESNFPVDKLSLSYHTYWNAMKKIASEYSASEQDALFCDTATRVYKLD